MPVREGRRRTPPGSASGAAPPGWARHAANRGSRRFARGGAICFSPLLQDQPKDCGPAMGVAVLGRRDDARPAEDGWSCVPRFLFRAGPCPTTPDRALPFLAMPAAPSRDKPRLAEPCRAPPALPHRALPRPAYPIHEISLPCLPCHARPSPADPGHSLPALTSRSKMLRADPIRACHADPLHGCAARPSHACRSMSCPAERFHAREIPCPPCRSASSRAVPSRAGPSRACHV